MDQVKIGKFIAECRKKQNLTQSQLAEKLFITDRAVSKWETGRAMPDSSLMLDLCNILNITVNDLLYGEVISMNDLENKQNELLLKAIKEKQEADKLALKLEILIGVLGCVILFTCVFIAAFANLEDWIRFVLIILGFANFLPLVFVALKIEQSSGYYQCKNCGHKYVPTYNDVVIAPHFGRTRLLKCPECGKKTWNKKVIKK